MNRRPSHLLAAAGAALLALTGAVALAGPASADTADTGGTPAAETVAEPTADPLAAVSDPDAAADTGPSCATQVPELDSPDQTVSQRVCFDSLAEALSYASGDHVSAQSLVGADHGDVARVVTDLNAPAGGLVAPSRGGAVDAGATTAAASSMVVGVVWRDKSWKGESEILWGSGPNGCFKGSTYGFPNLAKVLQNNVVSSADSFAGCWGTYYDSYSYGGSKLNCKPSCSSMGSMDNRTSSIVYRPRGTVG